MTPVARNDRLTLFDLPFETARERMATLRAARTMAPGSVAPVGGADQSPLRRLRAAIGGRLIAVGSALMADDAARQRSLRS